MRKISINETDHILIYGNAQEMVLKRYAKFQKYLLYKTGIGSDIESVTNHFQNLHSFIAHDMKAELKKEAENLHYNFYMILQEMDYEDLAFAVSIHSINGELLTDISEENLIDVVNRLSDMGMTKELLTETVEEIKKKILNDLKLYFPHFYTDSDDITFYQKIKQRIMLTADLIESGEEPDEIVKKLHDISRFFADLRKPNNFRTDEHDNCTVVLESNFESLCSMIEANGHTDAKNMTLIEFYSRLEFMRKSNEAAKNAYK